MPDDNLKSYTCAIHCWERKRKQRQHNIKCSLFHVKTKLTENIQKAREQALEQKLCIETWVNIETFSMSPLTKWMDLKLFYLKSIKGEHFDLKRDLLSWGKTFHLYFFHSHFHQQNNHNSAVCSQLQVIPQKSSAWCCSWQY